MTRIFIIITIFLFVNLTGCKVDNHQSQKIISPTGKYYLTASVNNADKSKNDYGVVTISLYNAKGQILTKLNTMAGDFNKWAINWDSKQDTVIMNSSDIGTYSWRIENNELKPIELTVNLIKRAEEIKKEKYRIDNKTRDVVQNNTKQNVEDSLYFEPYYFNMLYNYIINNGKAEKVNTSSRIDKPMYIEYRVLPYNKWELKVDKSKRIYFIIPQPEYKQYGNLLLTNDNVVKIECQDSANGKIIYEVYNEILKTIEKDN